MVIQNPKQLVDEFKKSGEFDRLRRQLLTHFANSEDEVRPLMSRVEEIARDKLSSDERLEHKTREAVHSEVMQDMERYPIVERAVADLAVLKNEALVASIEQYVRNIVRGESNDETELWNATTSRKGKDEDNDESSDYSEDDSDDELLIITEADRRNAAASSSPQHVDDAHADHSPSHSPDHQHESKRPPSRPTSPSTSRPIEPAGRSPRTPPWSADHEDNKPLFSHRDSPNNLFHGGNDSRSTLGVPSSDSMADDLLINGVPVDGLTSDDDKEVKESIEKEASQQTEPNHNTDSARTQSTSQGEGQTESTDINTGPPLGMATTSSKQKPDVDMRDSKLSLAPSAGEPQQEPHTLELVPPASPQHRRSSTPPYRSPTRSPTQSTTPLLPLSSLPS